MEHQVVAQEALEGELKRLAAQNAELVEHVTRMDRVEHGLGETARKPREMQPMPGPLLDYIRGFASRSTQKQMRDEAFRRHARGEPWEIIVADVIPKEDRETSTTTS
jgi:hypothetical protein